MRNRKQDLERLKKVTEAVWLATSQTLREKAGKERVAAAKASRLAQDRALCLKQIADDQSPDVAHVLSATKWMRWSETERARLNMSLAQIRAELAREQDAAKVAFARDQALETLLKQLAEQARKG